MDEFTDHDARSLLVFLHRYVTAYPDVSDSISDLAGDLAMSLDTTTDEDDRMRREIFESMQANS